MVDTKTLTKYKCILASFMSFIHNHAAGSEYPCDHVHAIEVLAVVTPNITRCVLLTLTYLLTATKNSSRLDHMLIQFVFLHII
jgi:hypothetical protein